MTRMMKILLLAAAAMAILAACASGGGSYDLAVDGDAPDTGDTPGEGCPPGTLLCGGSCIDVLSDHENCGACGNRCEAAANCYAGGCMLECPAGMENCDGSCVDVAASHDHCGACSSPCEAVEVCSAGSCTLECPAGKTQCSGACIDTYTDAGNCGGCGNVCILGVHATAVECVGGRCRLTCEAGWEDADPAIPGCESGCEGGGTETCDGRDNDCNGVCDDGFSCCRGDIETCTTTCGTTGTRTCSNTCSWGSCQPGAEACDGIDNDCDGTCDDGFECCRYTTRNCPDGSDTRTCGPSCTWSSCPEPTETCNGLDDDSDGQCDEDFECCRGVTRPCPEGCDVQTCGGSCTWDTCLPAATEICDAADQDCDGLPYGVDVHAVYSDVQNDNPCAPYIMAVTDAGYMQGDGGLFRPTQAVTRAQLAIVLQRAWSLGSPAPDPNDLCDVNDAGTEAARAIQALFDWHITEGTTASCSVGGSCTIDADTARYCPGDPLTRDHMAVFLYRTINKNGSSIPPCPSCPGFRQFDDSGSSTNCGCIEALSDDLPACTSDGTMYCPADTATRCNLAEAVARVKNLPLGCTMP
jgi:hypothetical protein